MGCGFGTWGFTVVTSTGKMSMTFKNLLHKRVGLFGSQQCCGKIVSGVLTPCFTEIVWKKNWCIVFPCP